MERTDCLKIEVPHFVCFSLPAFTSAPLAKRQPRNLESNNTDRYNQYLHSKPINLPQIANMLALALKADLEGYLSTVSEATEQPH
jgi:hypothetical protein